jgi:hypothetical protein
MMKNTLIFAGIMLLTVPVWTQTAVSNQDVYQQLARGTVYVAPSMQDVVSLVDVEKVAERIKPMTLKVVVVPSLGKNYIKNGRELRVQLAKDIFKKRLTLNNAIIILATRRGITVYSDKISEKKMTELENGAVKYVSKSDYTPAITWLATASSEAAQGQAQNKTTLWGLFIFIPLGVVVIIWAVVTNNRKQVLARALASAKNLRGQVIDGISYLDNYADLLPKGENSDAVRQYRQQADAKFEEATRILDSATKPNVVDRAKLYLAQAIEDIENGKKHIEAATEGTKVAFAVPDLTNIDGKSSATANATTIQDYSNNSEIFQPVKNCCFFCSRPGNGDLTPVTMTLDGQKRTVLACPEDLDELRSGRSPQLRTQTIDGKTTPWYSVPNYDPYQNYNDNSFSWNMISMFAMMSVFNPFAWGHSNYGGYGNYGGQEVTSADTSGLSDYETGGDFGTGDFGTDTGSVDVGGGDFGGGDFGGGDIGGGDIGGGDFGS